MTKAVVNLDFNLDERTIIEWKTLHWAGRKEILISGHFRLELCVSKDLHKPRP